MTTTSNVTVAMLTHNYLPAVGGAERQLNSLVPLFIERGITPVVYTRSRPGLPAVEMINGAKVVRVRCSGPKPAQSIMFVVGTLWQLLRTRPDVVHAYDTLTPSLVAGFYQMISKTPYLTKLLRSGELGDLNRLANKPMGRFRLGLLKRSVDKFVAISQDLENELSDRGIAADRQVFIPNGVDTERFRPPALTNSFWDQRRETFADWPVAPVVVIVGRVSPEKRVVELARQWYKLLNVVNTPGGESDTGNPWLYVVGEGPQSSELNGLDNVRFLGKREDVPEILRWSDVYVSASSAEGLSNALLEAMASGCASVVTNVGGVGDVMTHRTEGHIVEAEGPGRSPEAVVDDIIVNVDELLQDPDHRLKLGVAARNAVVERYSLTSTAEALAGQYWLSSQEKASR